MAEARAGDTSGEIREGVEIAVSFPFVFRVGPSGTHGTVGGNAEILQEMPNANLALVAAVIRDEVVPPYLFLAFLGLTSLFGPLFW